MQKTASATHVESDHDYSFFEKLIADRVAKAKGPLFATNAEELFAEYLKAIPEGSRQHYTCHCCRRFIERWGGLATIQPDGSLESLLWNDNDVPGFFFRSVAAMEIKVITAKVVGVFVNGDAVWGNPQTGNWTHLHGKPTSVFKKPLQTADQASAEKTQDFIILKQGLADYSQEAVFQAVRVLEADAVDRSEKTLGIAQWMLDLHKRIDGKKGKLRDNLIWLAVAEAPPGWCHVRSTMIATLLDDVVAGLPFDQIKFRWDAKMHSLRYQRPQAVPKQGNIDAANKVMEKLQSEGSLARRFARLGEVKTLWRPSALEEVPEKRKGGAFDHLKGGGKNVKEVELPAKVIFWDRFKDEVLPEAREIDVLVPSGRQPFYGLTTAVNLESPPILQWDGLEGFSRNPVAWYFWRSGSPASQWGLETGWHPVAAVFLKPDKWQQPDKFKHQGSGVFFAIEAARDSRNCGSALFPETLRNEYHGIRSVIEAHSNQAKLEGQEQGNANGLALQEKSSLTVRVRGKGGMISYQLSL